jgi:hypothetical protein
MGLECYLGEARCSTEEWAQSAEADDSLRRLRDEAFKLDGALVWGWERRPSLPQVVFPPDWDDTCKAIDYINAASDAGSRLALRLKDELPSSHWMHRALLDSAFQSPSGVGLSVFFSDGKVQLAPREDLMVTAVVLRTLGRWYGDVRAVERNAIFQHATRCVRLLQRCLGGASFARLSRYYFSAGHYALRLVQALRACELTSLLPSELQQPSRLALVIAAQRNQRERDWWLLVRGELHGSAGELAGLSAAYSHLTKAPRPRRPDIIFRHRRLGHYYGASDWTRRLQALEAARIEQRQWLASEARL